MHKYIIFFFSVSIFLFACKEGATPGKIINRDRMTDLLTEIHLVDGKMYNIDPSPDSLFKYGTARYLAVFKKFKTDSTQFRTSLKYYTSRPEELQAMYDKVSNTLKQKIDSLTKVQQKLNHALPPK